MTDTNIFFRRLGALVLDSVIFVVMFAVLMVFLSAIGVLIGACPASMVVFAGIISALFVKSLAFIYFVLLEGPVGKGQTLGKRLMKIKVVTEDGEIPGYGKSFVRNVLRIIDVLPGPYLVGAVLIFLTEKDQRLGDLAAKTKVVMA